MVHLLFRICLSLELGENLCICSSSRGSGAVYYLPANSSARYEVRFALTSIYSYAINNDIRDINGKRVN